MDWIEKLFGVSPDGGNGTIEFVIFLVIMTVVATAVGRMVRLRGYRASIRRRRR